MDKNTLEKRLLDEGLCQVGFCRLPHTAPGLPELEYAVTLVYRLSDAVLDMASDGPTYSYFQHYRAANALLDRCALLAGELIAREGYRWFPVAASQSVHDQPDKYTGFFQHKTAAVASGLGFIGRNAMFISHKFGIRIRLATVLTDMPLAEAPVIPEKSGCGDCRACADACPAHAVTGREWTYGMKRAELFDAEACSEHMKKAYQHIGRGSVCGICMNVCPYRHRRGNIE